MLGTSTLVDINSVSGASVASSDDFELGAGILAGNGAM